MPEKKMTRRDFLRAVGAVSVLGLGGKFLTGCGGGGEPCSDLSGLSAADRETRITLAYRSETLIPAKRCDNCHFWQAPPAGEDCGTCTVVKGPITAGGYCNSWAEPVPEGQEPVIDSEAAAADTTGE